MRLKLIPDNTKIDFFKYRGLTFGISCAAMVASVVLWLVMGLNFGIDFRGGTTIRTESESAVSVADYRTALDGLELGDVVISEIFDPTFSGDQHVASIRIQAQDETESASAEVISRVETALQEVDPTIRFTSVESVGPKVSGELVKTAFLAVAASLAAILFYIWLRFEWQFSLGAVFALFHDVLVTIGIFALFQIRFDLATIAALLTIIGYSINDTVVIFDRLRENLRKFKTMPLVEVMNVSVNETLSRTIMTSGTTLIALIALLVLGGDVIRGFVFAITWGVVIGTYSSVYVAKNVVLWFGVKRDWTKPDKNAGNQFANIDA
ncbi:protein translocase subunit SecF [Pseudooceanicola algae]|uniref:Protein-export membrane protein SecF n=1 Tax=Pseudooceanicola algae TaxID=1537215 RepID=A0A418SC52_9RHOB|nr:protein translocase subunit SecF [Pseudooceanicola algae]QPM89971.1 Protein translocase subunit SecF [Pseudooceanicola algae]